MSQQQQLKSLDQVISFQPLSILGEVMEYKHLGDQHRGCAQDSTS